MQPQVTTTSAQKLHGFGRLQSGDALSHPRSIVDATTAAMA